jgi:hypothetical protein
VADVAAVGCTRGDQSRLSTMGYSSRSVRCRGRNYATLSLFTMQWMRTRCQSKLNDDKYLGIEGVVGTKRAFTAVRHHEEVAVARCLVLLHPLVRQLYRTHLALQSCHLKVLKMETRSLS